MSLVYSSNIHAQGTTAQYSPTAAWCAIPATCWKKNYLRIVIHSCQFQWGNIWKFPQQRTFGSLTIEVRLLVLWMIHLLVWSLYFTTKTHFSASASTKNTQKVLFWLKKTFSNCFLSSKTLGFRIRVSSDVNTLCLKCRVGIRLLHHWSYIHVASFHQMTPSCWRLSGSCNSMITQLFRSWWNTKFLWTIGKPFQK